LLKGESNYYLGCNKDTCAVYYKGGQKVSDDFSREDIRQEEKITFNDDLGIVEIFDKDGNQISEW
jgi:hypothetical protein